MPLVKLRIPAEWYISLAERKVPHIIISSTRAITAGEAAFEHERIRNAT
jgi:hypothetical protein